MLKVCSAEPRTVVPGWNHNSPRYDHHFSSSETWSVILLKEHISRTFKHTRDYCMDEDMNDINFNDNYSRFPLRRREPEDRVRTGPH